MSTGIEKFSVVMRSKTSGGTDTQVIEVHPGQSAQEVAERSAAAYGAIVESVTALGNKFSVVMRSKSTFKTDTQVIEVHPGQTAQEVADRTAEGYGATVESVTAV